jgi:putative sigma-54 modulation protein
MKQTMEINIQAVHFDATEKLKEFATKKVEKLSKSYEDIKKVEVQMKLVKPQTALNKEVSLSVAIPGGTQYVEKTCDTFEESIDLCVDAMRVKLTKMKEKTRNH